MGTHRKNPVTALPKNQLMEGLHRLSREERLERVQLISGLSDDDIEILAGRKVLPIETAEHLIENVVGYFQIPLGVATNFCIDGKEILIPMAVEETSIIAAASAAAKWIKKSGTIRTEVRGDLIIGQIQIPSVREPHRVRALIQENSARLVELANQAMPTLAARGGGVRSIAVREIERSDDAKTMVVLHVLCDPCDAMGANVINQICEALKPHIESLTGERVGLCILSNLVDTKLAVAEVRIPDVEPKLGEEIEEAVLFAKLDPYRAATHNKGILNGIDPILIATGNDWRAVEAGAHAYAARSGKYQPLSQWTYDDGELVGRIELPLAVGVVGGVTKIHPLAGVALRMMKVEHASDLARICAAVGLVQNLGALKALVTLGIVRGHMQLHAANLAIAVGAEGEEIVQMRERLTEVLKRERTINVSRAREILNLLRAPEDVTGLSKA